MFWAWKVAILLGVTVGNILLSPRRRGVGIGAPSTLRQFNVPTNEQGTPIPYVCGTVLLDEPAVLWSGDFAVLPLIRGGETVAWKYHLGMQLGLCLGEIDELVEVRFDSKQLPGAPIAVSPDTDAIAMLESGVVTVVRVEQGFYADPVSLATATYDAINAALGRPDSWYRIVYGHQVVAGFNDRLRYAVRVSGVWEVRDITIPAGDYGTEFVDVGGSMTKIYEIAAAVETAVNAEEALHAHDVTVACAIDDTTKLFSLDADAGADNAVEGFRILGTGGTDLINTTLGIHHNAEVELEVLWVPIGHQGTVTGTFKTEPERYLFGGGDADTYFGFNRAETTMGALFGATGSRDYDGAGDISEQAVAFSTDEVTYTPGADSTEVAIQALSHYGPEDGVEGGITVYHGTDTQAADAYLESGAAIGPPLPAYRGLCHAVLRRFYMGNSGQFRPVAFVVRRCPDPLGLGAAVADLGGDANPALVIYDLLTSPLVSQRAVPADLVEADDFRAAARALFQEQLGLSLRFDTESTVSDMIDTVLRHIDAVRYTDPATGRIRLRLVRSDYELEDLLVLDQGNVASCEYGRRSWGDTRNVVKLTYVDRTAGFQQRVVQAIDAGNIETQEGSVAVESVTFEGFSSADRAEWAAERTLRTVAFPGSPVELVADRSAERLRPGDPFVLDWAPLGISGAVFRVGDIDLGTLADGVRITAIEDVWGRGLEVYTPPAVARWSPPVVAPAAVGAQHLEEAPYALAGGERRRVLVLAARGAGEMHGFEGWSDPAGGTAYARSNPAAMFTPTGVLTGVLGWTGDWLQVEGVLDLERLRGIAAAARDAGRNLLLVDDEWCAWSDLTVDPAGLVTITGLVRGILDTVPAVHQAGARVWFPSLAAPMVDEVDRDTDFTAAVKLRTRNHAGLLSLAGAVRATLTTSSRAARPYAPTAVTINGEAYPDAPISGDLTIAWAHRNRLAAWTAAGAGATADPEPGCTYTVRVYDEGDVLVHEAELVAGTTLTYAAAAQDWRVVVLAVTAAGESHQVFDYRIGNNHGWGFDYGNNWGGYRAS